MPEFAHPIRLSFFIKNVSEVWSPFHKVRFIMKASYQFIIILHIIVFTFAFTSKHFQAVIRLGEFKSQFSSSGIRTEDNAFGPISFIWFYLPVDEPKSSYEVHMKSICNKKLEFWCFLLFFLESISPNVFHEFFWSFDFNWDALCDLLDFVRFEKREKHPWASVTFSSL